MVGWGAGGALPALVHILVKGISDGRTVSLKQDTSEAGGNRRRLLQPFPERGAQGRAAGARRALGLVLRGDSHFKRVLLKAHPSVCGPGGGVY